METLSALQALCAGNSPVAGEFPARRPVTRSFDVFFDMRLNKHLSKQLRAGDLKRHRPHYDDIVTWLFIMNIYDTVCLSVVLTSHFLNGLLDLLSKCFMGLMNFSMSFACFDVHNAHFVVIFILMICHIINCYISRWHSCRDMCTPVTLYDLREYMGSLTYW